MVSIQEPPRIGLAASCIFPHFPMVLGTLGNPASHSCDLWKQSWWENNIFHDANLNLTYIHTYIRIIRLLLHVKPISGNHFLSAFRFILYLANLIHWYGTANLTLGSHFLTSFLFILFHTQLAPAPVIACWCSVRNFPYGNHCYVALRGFKKHEDNLWKCISISLAVLQSFNTVCHLLRTDSLLIQCYRRGPR